METKTEDFSWMVSELPGCSPVAVSHGAYVVEGKRGQGIGSEQHVKRIKYMEREGFTYALATVDQDNVAQLKIMEKNGWKLLDTFFNDCTEHHVGIYGKSLHPCR